MTPLPAETVTVAWESPSTAVGAGGAPGATLVELLVVARALNETASLQEVSCVALFETALLAGVGAV